MGKLALIGATVALLLGAAPAAARPVTATTARRVVASDRLAYPRGGVVVDCHRKRLGTLCRASNGGSCFQDAVLGPATLVGTTMWWVSRTRGKVSAVPVGSESFAVLPGCSS